MDRLGKCLAAMHIVAEHVHARAGRRKQHRVARLGERMRLADRVGHRQLVGRNQRGVEIPIGEGEGRITPGELLKIALLGCALSLMNFAIDEIINPKLRDQTRAGVSRADRKRLARAEAAAGTTEGATA